MKLYQTYNTTYRYNKYLFAIMIEEDGIMRIRENRELFSAVGFSKDRVKLIGELE